MEAVEDAVALGQATHAPYAIFVNRWTWLIHAAHSGRVMETTRISGAGETARLAN